MFTVRIAINVKVLLIIHFETIYQSYNNTSMNKQIIGKNAGILWRFLNTDAHKKCNWRKLKKELGLMIWSWPARSGGWHVKIKSSLSYSIQAEKIK